MSVNETKLLRRLLKPSFLPVQETHHFMKSDAIIHGKLDTGKLDKDGNPILIDQVVARILIDPDSGTINIHYYTDSRIVAGEIAKRLPRSKKPWMNNQMSTFSFGKQETWHNNPILFSDRHFGIKEWNGRPSSRHTGPYWVKKVKEVSNNPTDDQVDIWGRMTNVGEVSDIQIDTSQVDSRPTLHQQLYGTH